MQAWNDIYESPAILSAEWGHQRIYAAQSYARIRDLEDVPVVLPEAMALAALFPLCWKIVDDQAVLVALRSLMPDGRGHYHHNRKPLPLCLQAYPFAVPDPVAIERQQLIVDKAFADRPTDVGSPILLENGRMSRGALMRAKLALQAARSMQTTNALSDDLRASGFLEPWPLKFDLGHGLTAERSDLLVLGAARLGNPMLYGLVERHGPEAGTFLGVQRLSLFRISALLQLAKAAAATPLQQEAPESLA